MERWMEEGKEGRKMRGKGGDTESEGKRKRERERRIERGRKVVKGPNISHGE